MSEQGRLTSQIWIFYNVKECHERTTLSSTVLQSCLNVFRVSAIRFSSSARQVLVNYRLVEALEEVARALSRAAVAVEF
jgi:hypothetical protein